MTARTLTDEWDTLPRAVQGALAQAFNGKMRAGVALERAKADVVRAVAAALAEARTTPWSPLCGALVPVEAPGLAGTVMCMRAARCDRPTCAFPAAAPAGGDEARVCGYFIDCAGGGIGYTCERTEPCDGTFGEYGCPLRKDATPLRTTGAPAIAPLPASLIEAAWHFGALNAKYERGGATLAEHDTAWADFAREVVAYGDARAAAARTVPAVDNWRTLALAARRMAWTYGTHRAGCPVAADINDDKATCSCGFDALADAICEAEEALGLPTCSTHESHEAHVAALPMRWRR